jgi:hypothetical protein
MKIIFALIFYLSHKIKIYIESFKLTQIKSILKYDAIVFYNYYLFDQKLMKIDQIHCL